MRGILAIAIISASSVSLSPLCKVMSDAKAITELFYLPGTRLTILEIALQSWLMENFDAAAVPYF